MIKKICVLGILSLVLNACREHQPADLILYNARVYTVDSAFQVHEALAIKDGKILEAGTTHNIRYNFRAPKSVDLEGKFVYPGLIDAHCHFVGYAKGLKEVNLWGTQSFDEVIERVQEFQAKEKVDFIIGRGWDQNDWSIKEFPHNTRLNQLFPETPVLLTRIDGHAVLVNQAALDYAGITADTLVNGGILEKNGDGTLTGILIDNAVDLVSKPDMTPGQLTEVLRHAEQNCLAYGLTTLDDAGLEKQDILFLDSLQKAGVLKLRLYTMVADKPESRNYFLDKGPYKTDRLNVRSLKFYADGALGSRGACLLEPYSDKSGHYGLLLDSISHFQSSAAQLAEKGWQMNTHAIGDSANRIILQTYGQYTKDSDRRWRIEHAQVVKHKDFDLFREYNVMPSVQPTHATSDMYWAEERLGPKRLRDAYAYKMLLEKYGKIALGTDFPVEDISTLKTFYAATIRKDVEGLPEGGFQKENALSREEALRGMTIWAAFSNFEEAEKGSIEPTKFADIVIMDTDLMECKPTDILKAKVLQTYINGELVYSLEEKSAK
ncbi:MAG: amidohydrolase [Owenweeksia sp.]